MTWRQFYRCLNIPVAFVLKNVISTTFFYIMNVVSPLDAHPTALQWVQRGRVVAACRETEYIDTISSGPDGHCTEQVFT